MPRRREAIAALEAQAAVWVGQLLAGEPYDPAPGMEAQRVLTWLETRLLPDLRQTPQELTQLLRGLGGHYVPSGPAGAPSRGRPEVLPTGRNFYGVDVRAIPTETAWDVGQRAAQAVIDRYTQDQGEYPRTLALSVWGTATLRTGGDDFAEALALLGVRPVWAGPSRRVVDFEILPLSYLGRPRVDVTLRVSGFFRDSFPHLLDFFSQAVRAVAQLAESPADNPLAAQVAQDTQAFLDQGLPPEPAYLRVFGPKPGSYGAGLQGLIAAQSWETPQDLATAFLNWSGYGYTGAAWGEPARDVLCQRLQNTEIVLHNQDNREHDILDSDDYYQFQGGLTVAIRTLTGENPIIYHGDHSRPPYLKIRTLKEEIQRVYRSRVVNPKWIQAMMRHGYKGAFELAATVDYFFAYDATAQTGADYMYQGMAQAYLFNPQVRAFLTRSNPWALRGMAERFWEAHQRGQWRAVDPELLAKLRRIIHETEALIEQRGQTAQS
ncbi:hydrogenobyrinic acid a,c-diamide cobaltochelatase [Gloeomargarita lithophora Alchichica-D10]|uniref:Hydrogenobyrinic acid a,c-diamide cobaltochelatase n=1 Tax=Gloeomargarita lithophora Alchichica-D10 TaxID=1188229 RepID=A0A1J0A8Y0_9CYAN|nr:cobaltochelatase subunit CobN [Gloeomargarita lithophora]APB32388.1 hydrogenobyrinic acid a,c-diamide cobaltochelatase [Gloeomargarita lithophora Alchichica-D10]